jgi:hypothetical protein
MWQAGCSSFSPVGGLRTSKNSTLNGYGLSRALMEQKFTGTKQENDW